MVATILSTKWIHHLIKRRLKGQAKAAPMGDNIQRGNYLLQEFTASLYKHSFVKKSTLVHVK